MNILFEEQPTGTTHFFRYASGYIVWCKVEDGQNNQPIIKEWDSGNEYWVPGIYPIEHYQKIGLTSIDDLPTQNDVDPDAAACIQLVDAGFGWTNPSVSANEMLAIIAQHRRIEGQGDTLLPQAEAAHPAGHALGLPGGTDITVELVPAVNGLLAAQVDHQRLVRELDVLLNGEAGAAQQASLCDLVAQVAKDGVVAKARFDAMLEAMHGLAGVLDELSQEDAVSSLKGGAAGAASGIRKSIIKIMGAAPAAGEGV